MTKRRTKNVALHQAANQIRKATGYGGLEKMFIKAPETGDGKKGASELDRDKNQTIKKFAEVIVDDIDGARFGKDISLQVESLSAGSKSSGAGKDVSDLKVFNAHIDLFLDGEKSVKKNKGSVFKTADFAPDIIFADKVQNPESAGADTVKIASVDPNGPTLTVINSNHIDFDPTVSFLAELDIFANAIPTVELSRCVPYLEVNFQTSTQALDEKGGAQSISLVSQILGNQSIKGQIANEQIATAMPADPEEIGKKSRSSFGMEMFTSPQTLVPVGGNAGRNNPILDPFRPLLSINSFDLSVLPARGLIEKRTARLNLTLHDRSRLSEISELVRPENFGTNEIIIEYGWSHPDKSDNNPYGKFLNALRVREKFGVTNNSFSLGQSGEVQITLEIMAKGMFEMENVSIIDNKSLSSKGDVIQKVSREVMQIIKSKSTKKKRKDIKAVNYLESHLNRFSTVFTANLEESVKNLQDMQKKSPEGSPYTKNDVKQMIDLLGDLSTRIGEYDDSKTKVLKSIERQLYSDKTADPFNLELKGAQPPFNLAENKKASGESKFISIGKIFSNFVGRSLLSSGKYSEVQLIFYGFASESGFNGNLSKYSIGEFLVREDEFKDALDHLIKSRRTASIPLDFFMTYMINNFIKYPFSPLCGFEEKSIIRQELIKGRRQSLGEATKTAKSGTKKVKGVNARLDNTKEKIKTFRKPNVTVRLETVPAIFSDETSKKVEDRKSILKVHVFDKNMGRHEAFKKLISAATDNLDTVKSLSSELKEVRKDSTNLEDRKNQITKLIKKLTEEGQIKISKIDNTDPPEYKIDASFEELKRVIAKSFPSITYGSQNSIAISAQFKSIQNSKFRDIQLLRYARDPNKSPPGAQLNGLPIKVQPTDMSLTMLGCPIIKYAQHFFVDFGTGTSIDDLYFAKTVSHSFRPGSFTTSLQMSTRDADGQYESMLQLLNRAEKSLKDLSEGE
jgi:hypothetical protein